MIINDMLNNLIGTTEYAPLTDAQIAAVLRTTLNPSNRYLPINSPIRIPFLARFVNALEGVKKVSREPYGGLLGELVDSYREFLRIGCPTPRLRGDILWNLGGTLSHRFNENEIKQDLEDSINAYRDCLAIANHSEPRWSRLFMLGRQQTILCNDFDSANNIDETISTLDECLKLFPTTPGIGSESTCH